MVLTAGVPVRTSGWTFHRGEQRDDARPSESPVRMQTSLNRTDIIAKIQATSHRFVDNRALASAGLSESEWHDLFQALIEAESGYRPAAMSTKGAYGLGQLMPATARALRVDRRNVDQNLDGSARYLLAQLSAFGDVDLALAAYNAGPHRVIQYGGVPPFAETRGYIARVHRIRARLARRRADAGPVRVSAQAIRKPIVVLDLN